MENFSRGDFGESACGSLAAVAVVSLQPLSCGNESELKEAAPPPPPSPPVVWRGWPYQHALWQRCKDSLGTSVHHEPSAALTPIAEPSPPGAVGGGSTGILDPTVYIYIHASLYPPSYVSLPALSSHLCLMFPTTKQWHL